MNTATKQNLTLSLNATIIQKAKVVAAKRSTSVSALIADQLELLVNNDEAYEASRRSALMRMEKGFHMGVEKLPAREELYDR